MKNRNAFVPTAPDPLEDRVVLSQVMVGPVALVAPRPHPIALHGTINGTEVPITVIKDGPGALRLKGAGTVSPLGTSHLLGLLTIRSGEPTFYHAEVSLSNAGGTLRIQITGVVGGPSGPPAHLHYQILGGSGIFTGAKGQGAVVYTQSLAATGHSTQFSLAFG